MGEAKRRKEAGTAPVPASPERQLVAKAALHFYQNFVRPVKLVGGCYYASMALRHHLGHVHNLNVAAIAGFARPQKDGFRWSSHMWIEFDGRPTDITLCMAIPPDFPGKLLVDGQERSAGAETFYSKDVPNDGAPVDIDMRGQVGSEARKERSFYAKLASEGLDEVGAYLKTAPRHYQILTDAAWRSFRP